MTLVTNGDLAVRDLLDKQAIREVLLRYCRGIDRVDGELIRSVYHDDAVEDHGAFAGKTPDEFVGYATERSHVFSATSHYVTNQLIELDGDVASSEAYFLVVHRGERDGEAYDVVAGGRYVDRFERRNGEWKIARRTVVHDWSRVDPVTEAWERAGFFVQGVRSRDDPAYARP
jgi:hypothetical protein